MKTPFKTKEQARENKQWYLLDAKGKTLGRFASEVVKILRGKHKVDYTPNVNTGDGVIIINAKDIEVTGAKEAQKIYYHYTGYIGGMKETPYRVMKEKHPENILLHAIEGMLPRTKLTDAQLKKLRIFGDEKHGLEALRPITINI